ncbi:M57 family metalloprotease [Dyadobacter frigoris]|uniref:Peptidase metallopeptidase domain-containing protein n=1 Tax=Dyadobacter frigoris TaxID=2576211 RepID=A0A4U6D2H7_9BACT|nr:M57 family metalloprotease [Dyadobacter frigoris]TKT90846.1 hypothetical protein FDK13_17925 [Dyadobacter frigoris]
MMKKLLLFVMMLTALVSCQQSEIQSIKNEEAQVEKSDQVYEYIKSLGFKDDEIKDLGKDYLVDGDMLFDKSVVPDSSKVKNGRVQQYGVSNYVGYNVQPNITVRIDPSMNVYASEIAGAIAIWNSVTNCRVNFTLSTANDANITIYNSDLGSQICGASYTPINGLPSGQVYINNILIANNSFAQRQRTIAHELGHAIGFFHTNWMNTGESRTGTYGNQAYYDAKNILGTPVGTDANSLMNGGECGIGATALSSLDIVAVQFMYPENPPVAGTIPVFRYFSRTTTQDHYYTWIANDLGNGSNNDYIFEGVAFFAYPTQVTGTVPLYRYFHTKPGISLGDHFYTLNQSDVSSDPTYLFEGIAFYVYSQPLNNSVPVHRYWSSSYDDHFYTKNQNEVTGMAGNYSYEDVVFFAH